MKNKIGLFLIIFGILICIVAFIFLYSNKKNNVSTKYLSYEVINDGYTSYDSRIISSYGQYLDFISFMDEENSKYGKIYDFDKERYSDNYFNNKSLAIINIVTGSGMNKLKDIKLYTKDSILYCDVDIEYAKGMITTDIHSKLVLVEIDKGITNIKFNH